MGRAVSSKGRRGVIAWVVSAALCLTPVVSHGATFRCPDSRDIPQLTIRGLQESPLPVLDSWQVFLEDVPLSDAQVALLAGSSAHIDLTTSRLNRRGGWVYWGLAASALGLAVSSTGWVLYGQNKLPQNATLSIALGGLVVGVVGVLFTTETIQKSVEPLLAPTPSHVISRAEMRRLVAGVNNRFYKKICDASDKAWGFSSGDDLSLVPELRRPDWLVEGAGTSDFVK